MNVAEKNKQLSGIQPAAWFVSATTSEISEVVQRKQSTFVNAMSGSVRYAGC